MKKVMMFIATVFVFTNLWASDWVNINSDIPVEASKTLVSADQSGTTINFKLDGFFLNEVETPRGTAYTLKLENASPILIKSAPDLLKMTSSVLISDLGKMEVKVVSSEYTDYPNIEIAPSKGNLTRDIDPASVPFEYGSFYNRDQFYPGKIAELRSPYIIRDYRGQTVVVYPFQYNPITKVLRVYHNITVEVIEVGTNGINPLIRSNSSNAVNAEFSNIYNRQFINAQELRKYDPVEEVGNMLIISHANYMDAMAPFIAWKKSIGMPVEMVDVAIIGNSADIKNYIADYYNSNGLTFVLLVGDAADVPSSYSNGDSDVDYSYVVGNDHYPDLFVGRFSAQTIAHVETQVQRTLDYEQGIHVEAAYAAAAAVGSDQGPGDDNEMDYEHLRNIHLDLMAFTYDTEYEFFDGSQGGLDAAGSPTSAMVAAAINGGGVGILNYTGHGSDNAWSSSGFSSTNVNALTNTEVLPFIWAVACVNGNFVGGTCFAEAWLRAEHNGEPSGAIATMMSTINQSWNPPMEGQDAMNDILVESFEDNIKRTFAGISFNGCMQMNDEYGSAGDDMTDTWLCFGDPSLLVRTAQPAVISVTHNPTVFLGSTEFSVNANSEGARVVLSLDGEMIASAIVEGGIANLSFDALSNVGMLNLAVLGFNAIPYLTEVEIIPASGPYVVFASYELNDAAANNNGILDYNEAVLFNIDMKNVGIEVASNVQVTLSTADTYITITDNNESFGNIGINQTVSINDAFAFSVSADVPDEHNILFNLESTDGTEIWNSSFSIVAHAPILEYGGFSIADPNGNNNGNIDPGETIEFTIQLNNIGGADAYEAIGELISNDSYLTINGNPMSYGDIAAGENSTAVFTATAAANTPVGYMVALDVDFTANFDLTANGSFNVVIGQIPIVVIDLDGNTNSGTVMIDAINDIGLSAEYLTAIPNDLNLYSTIFLCLGIYSDNHSLNASEGQAFADYLDNGGSLYMEGGDTWYYDTPTSVHAMFNINGISDGASDLGTIIGQAGTICDGMSFNYSGDNNWIDVISAESTAVEILKNQSPDYATTIAFDGGDYKTIGSSLEFGGLDDATSPSTKTELMEEYLIFFGVINNVLTAEFSANVVDICENENVSFTNLSNGGEVTSYEWTFEGGNPATSSDENPVVSYAIPGEYDVTLIITGTDAQSTKTKENYITVHNCMGIKDIRNTQIDIYPNPTKGKFVVALNLDASQKVDIKIVNSLGETIISKKDIAGNTVAEFDFSDKAEGLYMIIIENTEGRQIKKLLFSK